MVHTENNERKKYNKEVKKKYSPKGNFHFKCFLPEERYTKK